jgi:hypothetical protein
MFGPRSRAATRRCRQLSPQVDADVAPRHLDGNGRLRRPSLPPRRDRRGRGVSAVDGRRAQLALGPSPQPARIQARLVAIRPATTLRGPVAPREFGPGGQVGCRVTGAPRSAGVRWPARRHDGAEILVPRDGAAGGPTCVRGTTADVVATSAPARPSGSRQRRQPCRTGGASGATRVPRRPLAGLRSGGRHAGWPPRQLAVPRNSRRTPVNARVAGAPCSRYGLRRARQL